MIGFNTATKDDTTKFNSFPLNNDTTMVSLQELELATGLIYDVIDQYDTTIKRASKRTAYDTGCNVAAWLLMVDNIDTKLSPRDLLFIK